MSNGLPPTNTWVAAEPCATDGDGLVSIIDNITITGSPGAITSVANDQPIWSLVLNDGTATSNFRIDRYQGGVFTNSPVVIANATGTVTFADPVMLAADPTQSLQAATKHYVDANAAGLTDAPSDGQWYARQSAAWTPSAGSVAGRTGAVVLTHADITDWTATLAPYALTTSIPAASTAFPVMDGTAAVGVGTTWARADHVHPVDTSRYAASNPSGYQTAAQVTAALPVASSTTPAMDGTAAVGVGTTWARADHVHPTDTHAMGDNRIINGNFAINQRGQVSGTALAAAAYGHDRWKAGAAGCTYTFTPAIPDTTITITAGSLTQIIEAGWIEGGAYTLSWTGTAQARVYQGTATGAYAASPIITPSLPAGINTIVEFNAGTAVRVKFESGSVATPFNRQSLAKSMADCQRYFFLTQFWFGGYGSAGSTQGQQVSFPVTMRATPTLVFTPAYTNCSNVGSASTSPTGFSIVPTVTATGSCVINGSVTAAAEL